MSTTVFCGNRATKVRDSATTPWTNLKTSSALGDADGVELRIVRNYVGHRVRHGVDREGAAVDLVVSSHSFAAGESCLERVGSHLPAVAVRRVEPSRRPNLGFGFSTPITRA